MILEKYDVVLVNLNPRKWHTQSGIRPCVIIQSNLFNKYSSTVLVVPLTKVEKDIFPSEFWIIPTKSNWLDFKSRFLWSQIITVDKNFIIEKKWKLEPKYYEDIFEAIKISLDLENNY